jgi:hypothetical protein
MKPQGFGSTNHCSGISINEAIMKRLFLLFSFFLAVGLALWPEQSATAKEEGNGKNGRNQRLAKPTGVPTRTLVNVGQLAMWIYADGLASVDPDGNSGIIFPRGTAGVIYQDGLIFGGYVQDGIEPALRVGGQAYTTGMQPGRIISKGKVESLDALDVRLWRIRRDYKDADLTQDAAEVLRIPLSSVGEAEIAQIRAQYEKDWNEWPWQKGAPWYDTGVDGLFDKDEKDKDGKGYDPVTNPDPAKDNFPIGTERDGTRQPEEAPGLANADQVVWVVCNDYSSANTIGLYGSPPIGVEEQITLWAYRRSDALGHAIFKQFKLIYKGLENTPANATIDTLYMCQWSDPDLGSFGDDFAGCDPKLSLGFIYNSVSLDATFQQFALAPPASGYDFFAGPAVDGAATDEAIINLKRVKGKRNLPMTTFAFFAAGQADSDPDRGGPYSGTQQWWNLLRGFRPRPISPPQRKIDPTTTQPSLFWVSGDPTTQTGWLDAGPGDRRILMSSGPVAQVSVGDTIETVVAMVAGIGSDRLSSVKVLKFYDNAAQIAFNQLFDLPKAPPSPKFTLTPLDGAVVIDWGSDLDGVAATEGQDEKTYKFEGYNVYQLPSASASISQAVKLATFDLQNEITTIKQTTFDPQSGELLDLPAQLGKNTGIQRSLRITTDKLRERPLSNGQTYYFTVTAYNYSPVDTLAIRTLESPLQITAVVPQTPRPGVRYAETTGQSVAVTKVSGTGFSDVKTLPITVVDPTKTKSADYRVSIDKNAQGNLQWTLRNLSAGQDLLTSANLGSVDTGDPNDDFDFPIVNGLRIAVPQVPARLISDSTKFVKGTPWLEGFRYDAGSPASADHAITTGADLAVHYLGAFGSNFNPRNQVPVLLKFGPSHKQKAYRLRRTGPGATYLIQPTNPTPEINVTAFEVTDPKNPRQLTISWRDQIGDGVWNPAVGTDNVEVIFIHFRSYDPTMSQYAHSGNGQTEIPSEVTIGDKADIMYGVSFAVVEGHTLNESDIEYKIRPIIRLGQGDQYTFSTKGTSELVDVAKKDVDVVNVFPNPYYGLNRAEIGRFDRYVTFNHLPKKATIRIFTLAGVLVRTLMKDDATQFRRWDLQNEEGLPAASGIYIVHIDMPDLGKTKVLKLAMVREEQFVPNY